MSDGIIHKRHDNSKVNASADAWPVRSTRRPCPLGAGALNGPISKPVEAFDQGVVPSGHRLSDAIHPSASSIDARRARTAAPKRE